MRKARVFISCGQRNENEKQIGKHVEAYFKDKGFETYFAEMVHSSEALTENIFRFLAESEYFIFIDFKRDELSNGSFRGSLFVNQEIAIATFLKINGLGFIEKDVAREGILQYQIYNAITFSDEEGIFSKLDELIADWDTESVNELQILFDPESINRNVVLLDSPGQPHSDWYHLEVRNRNKTKHAFSCVGYVSRIKGLATDETMAIPTNELVWAGIGELSVNLIAGTARELDAFFLIQGEGLIRFHQRPSSTSNPRYHLPALPRGRYLIEYMVISSNFKTTQKAFLVNFGASEADIEVSESVWK
jgi:hypothetical protein